METETIVMSSRRRMVLKPLSPAATLQCKEQNSSDDTNEHILVCILYIILYFNRFQFQLLRLDIDNWLILKLINFK